MYLAAIDRFGLFSGRPSAFTGQAGCERWSARTQLPNRARSQKGKYSFEYLLKNNNRHRGLNLSIYCFRLYSWCRHHTKARDMFAGFFLLAKILPTCACRRLSERPIDCLSYARYYFLILCCLVSFPRVFKRSFTSQFCISIKPPPH